MLRLTANVVDVVLLQFLLELRLAPPVGVLPPVVREHLLGRSELRDRLPIDIQHISGRLTAEHLNRGDVSRVVVDEPDDVGHLAQDREVRDVSLPHLVGRRSLESPFRGRGGPPPAFRLRQRQRRGLQVPAHRLRTGLHEEEPTQYLRDPPDPAFRFLLFQFRDLRANRRREFRPSVG